jgi:rod shape-determining protein MreC
MFRYITRNKGLLALVIIILASFLWMTSQARQPGGPSLLERGVNAAAYPFVKTIRFTTGTAKRVWTGYFYLVGLVKENERLERDNGRLMIENVKLRESVKRQRRMESLLALKEEEPSPVLAAKAVGRDASSWFKSVLVDVGENDGVRKNMPAAVYTGLVGRVLRAYGGASRVMLITDPGSAVSCMTERTRDTGILVGDGTGLCRLLYVDKSADVAQGDLLIASGLDGIYPQGMPVGEVVKASGSAPGYFQDVQVRPTADIDHLEELAIILR